MGESRRDSRSLSVTRGWIEIHFSENVVTRRSMQTGRPLGVGDIVTYSYLG